jgi:hypothetical protein
MSAELHKFRDDLQNRPAPGSNAPPVTIRAKDLDENFTKVTVLESETDPPEYDVEYTERGILLSKFLPPGTNQGDLLYWDGEAWSVLPAPQDNEFRVLAIQSGNLTWAQTEDC